jgi:hypothetical protein
VLKWLCYMTMSATQAVPPAACCLLLLLLIQLHTTA